MTDSPSAEVTPSTYCLKCNTTYNPANNFCVKCGVRLITKGNVPEESNNQDSMQSTATGTAQSNTSSMVAKINKAPIIIGIAAVLVSIAGIFGYHQLKAKENMSLPSYYRPSTVGSTWTYRVTNSVKKTAAINTRTIISSDKAGFVMNTIHGDSRDGKLISYYSWINKNLFFTKQIITSSNGSITTEFSPGMLLLPSNLSKGSSTDYYYKINTTGYMDGHNFNSDVICQGTMTPMNTETVITEAGTFQALKIVLEEKGQGSSSTSTASYWYAPGVGNVKSITIKNDRTIITELISYHINK
jgi:hypothetical protein